MRAPYIPLLATFLHLFEYTYTPTTCFYLFHIMVTSVVTAHPLEVLGEIVESYEVDEKISQSTSKEQLKEIRENFTDQHEMWELRWKRAMKDHDIVEPEAAALAKQYKKVRRRLCLKLLSSEFRRKYEDEFAVIQGSTDFFALLEDIIGKVSVTDQKNKAEDKLTDIVRRVKEEETFTRFFERIDKLAHTASSGEVALKNYFIKKAFFSNLTPDQKRYLLDHNKENENAKEAAKFLDSKQKHRCKPTIKAVSAGELQLQEQVAALTAQLAAVPDIIKEALGTSVKQAVSTQLHSIRDEIGDITKSSSRPENDIWMDQLLSIRNEIGEIKRVSSRPEQDTWSDQRRQDQIDHVETTARFTDKRQQSENRPRESRPKERCKRCGYTNHKTEDCRGGSTKRCFVCDQIGHMSFVCPHKPKYSKN